MSEAQDIQAAVKIGQLETQMNNIEKKVELGFVRMEASIAALSAKVDVITELKNDISNLKTEMATLKKSRSVFNWLVPTVSAVSGAVITILTINFLAHGGK